MRVLCALYSLKHLRTLESTKHIHTHNTHKHTTSAQTVIAFCPPAITLYYFNCERRLLIWYLPRRQTTANDVGALQCPSKFPLLVGCTHIAFCAIVQYGAQHNHYAATHCVFSVCCMRHNIPSASGLMSTSLSLSHMCARRLSSSFATLHCTHTHTHTFARRCCVGLSPALSALCVLAIFIVKQ